MTAFLVFQAASEVLQRSQAVLHQHDVVLLLRVGIFDGQGYGLADEVDQHGERLGFFV